LSRATTRPTAGGPPPQLTRPEPVKALRRKRRAWIRKLRRQTRRMIRQARAGLTGSARRAASGAGRAMQGEARRAWRDFRQSLDTARPAPASRAAKKSARKQPAPKPRPIPGAGKPCQRCHNTGVIPVRRGGRYAGSKPCPHIVKAWQQARPNNLKNGA
jgi:hypothetical protein